MSHVTSKDGTKIAFDKQGDGRPVILIGGATQYRSFDERTRQLAELLAKDVTVINYDRRGRGESGDTEPYATQREIEDLDALIAEAGGSASVFGMSSGAAVALEAAADGLAIDKIAVYEAPYIVDGTRPAVPADFTAQLSELIANDRRGDAVELFMTTVALAPAEMVGGMRAMPFWGGFEAVAHTLVYDQTFMGTHQLPKRCADVDVPVLVAGGGASPEWMHSAAEALAAALPKAQRKTLDGQAHDVAPDVLAPVLAEFYNG